MEPLNTQDTLSDSGAEQEASVFGKAPQPWQLRNSWLKPKRIRKRASLKEIDLWQGEK